MEKYVKKYFWTINLLTIALCAFLAAKTANTFVGAYLANSETDIKPVHTTEKPHSPADKPPEKVERKATLNPFTGQPLEPAEEIVDAKASAEPPPPPPQNPADFNENTECNSTSLPGTLIATVASSNPRHSFVMILGSDNAVNTFEIGQNIQNGVVLVAVIRHRAFITNNGKLECYFQGDEGKKAKKPQATAQAEEGGGGEGVRKVSETEYIVAQNEVAKAMENMNALATQARIAPNFEKGVVNGFKIWRIKPGSLYQKIGIDNGDVIQRVNGMEINSPEKALEIYSKLKNDKNVTIDLLRNGSKVSMNYTIQ